MSRTRVTRAQLEAAANLVNRMTGNAEHPYTRNAEGKLVANIGNFHISGAYGGFSLQQMVSDGGASRDVLHCGHISARELLERIHAYRYGIEMGRANMRPIPAAL